MSGWLAAVLSVVAAVNPPAFARLRGWAAINGSARSGAAADAQLRSLAIGSALLLVAVLVAEPVLKVLDTSAPTFRLGAAVVLGLSGAKTMVWLPTPVTDRPGTLPAQIGLALTAVATPAGVLTAMAASADAGLGTGIVSVVVTAFAVAATVMVGLPRWSQDLAARFVGAGAVVVAVAIGLDAARTV